MEEIIIKKILESMEKQIPVALITMTEVNGSTPRDPGSLMLVWRDGSSFGSIGGGKVEYFVIKEAVEALEKNADRTFDHSLTPSGDLEMQCGGTAKGYIKVFKVKNKLLVAGGGHVGEKVIELAKFLGFYCIVADDREEYSAKESLGKADRVVIGAFGKICENVNIDSDTYVVITTKSHVTDLEILEKVLRTDAKYIGVIGSKSKQRYARKELFKMGFTLEDLKRIYGPVGLDIANQLPEEIAVSILSEILLIKNNTVLDHRRLKVEELKALLNTTE